MQVVHCKARGLPHARSGGGASQHWPHACLPCSAHARGMGYCAGLFHLTTLSLLGCVPGGVATLLHVVCT